MSQKRIHPSHHQRITSKISLLSLVSFWFMIMKICNMLREESFYCRHQYVKKSCCFFLRFPGNQRRSFWMNSLKGNTWSNHINIDSYYHTSYRNIPSKCGSAEHTFDAFGFFETLGIVMTGVIMHFYPYQCVATLQVLWNFWSVVRSFCIKCANTLWWMLPNFPWRDKLQTKMNEYITS